MNSMPFPDEFADIQAQLNLLPAPELAPVDVARIVGQSKRHSRQLAIVARRLIALAAVIVLVVASSRCEVVVNNKGLRVTWSRPAAMSASPNPDLEACLARLEAELRQPHESAEISRQVTELRDILLTLAGEVRQQKRHHESESARLNEALADLERATREQFRQTEQTQSAMYHAIFPSRPITPWTRSAMKRWILLMLSVSLAAPVTSQEAPAPIPAPKPAETEAERTEDIEILRRLLNRLFPERLQPLNPEFTGLGPGIAFDPSQGTIGPSDTSYLMAKSPAATFDGVYLTGYGVVYTLKATAKLSKQLSPFVNVNISTEFCA